MPTMIKHFIGGRTVEGSGGRIGVENQPSGRYIVKSITRSQNGVQFGTPGLRYLVMDGCYADKQCRDRDEAIPLLKMTSLVRIFNES